MDELMDLLAKDESSSQISDKIKDILFSKSAERIEAIRPTVAASIFDDATTVNYEDEEELVGNDEDDYEE